MAAESDGELLLEHLEESLGTMKTRWRGKENYQMPFEVFVFTAPPMKSHALVTFGLSAHDLKIDGNREVTVRMEFAIHASSAYDSKALGALLFAVGLDVLGKHMIPDIHAILEGTGPVLSNGNPRFEHLYLGSPLSFSPKFASCETTNPVIQIVQIIPISSREKAFVEVHGWAAFEEIIKNRGIDMLAFDSRQEIV